MTWTPTQRIILATTPKITSFMTFFGSAWVMVEVIMSKQKRSHPYHRLLLGMSTYDCLEAMGNFCGTWPVPYSRSWNQVWAMGNQQTCTTQGILLTIAIAVPIYNAMLAVYYMMVINHNVSDKTLRKYFEPSVHVMAFLWAFCTAVAATTLNLYNSANLWCWIAPYPHDCLDSWRHGKDGNCIRGDNAWIYRWAFYFAPLWCCILIATVCTILVYRRVRSLDKQSLRYRRPESFMLRSSRDSFGHGGTSGDNNNSQSFRPPVSTVEAAIRQARAELHLANEERKDDAFLSGRSADDNSTDDFHVESATSNAPNVGFFGRWQARRNIYREDYRRSVEVANQAVWYLGVFYLTHVWSTTTRIIQQVRNGKTFFGVVLFHSWFDPWQGFLNFVVYQRPRYLKIRKAEPHLGRFGAVWRALRFSHLPPAASSGSTVRPERSSLRWSGREETIAAAIGKAPTEVMPAVQEGEEEEADEVASIEDDDCSEVFA